MSKCTRSLFRQLLTFVLCFSLLLSGLVLPARAEESNELSSAETSESIQNESNDAYTEDSLSEAEAAVNEEVESVGEGENEQVPFSLTSQEETASEDTASEDEIVTVDEAVQPKYTWGVENSNYFDNGETFIIDGYKISEMHESKPFQYNDGNYSGYLSEEAVETFKNLKEANYDILKKYTAVILEFIGSEMVDGFEGVEYVVDAVIDGSKNSEVALQDLDATAPTSETNEWPGYGFVFYIPTDKLNSSNTPRVGDLVDASFWHVTEKCLLGLNGFAGNLRFYESPMNYDTVTNTTNVNATVKIFNYDSTINEQGDGNGFVFFNGFWGYGSDIESVDGYGSESDHGTNENPIISDVLDANGYPQIIDKSDASEGTLRSLAYLFDGSATRKSDSNVIAALMGTMTNGGGLFQQDEDGYYYYDSLKNAAYFDQTANQFVLYKDLIVRPWYNSYGGDQFADSTNKSDEAYGNFLPFNPVTSTNNTVDGSLEKAGTNVTDLSYILKGSRGIHDSLNNELTQNNIISTRLEDKVDMWFGMTVDFEFYMPEDGKVDGEEMIFDFHGDDDVFVYLGVWNENTAAYDYKLVLDIGGSHASRSGYINFSTGTVKDYPANNNEARERTLKQIFELSESEGTFEDYTKLSLKFFYLERGGNISHCNLDLIFRHYQTTH